jgi:gliding motility-associated-like protein
MKYILSILLNFLFISFYAQCFQIESILVDACAGSDEGKNEMVIFKIGSSALNTSNLTVSWPNNNWLGLTQNATTASAVSSLNSTILGCGLLKEPIGGVLPANSKVLLVTSTAFNTSAQSFVNLTDTLIVIFQSAGNTAGHFANYNSGGGFRTLTINFSGTGGCSDAVTYDRALLVNQSGANAAQDGATVEFTPSGVATYTNRGCQAPYIPLSVDAGPTQTICAGSTINLNAIASGSYNSINWVLGSGASGNFNTPNSLSTTYTSGLSETGSVKLYCNLIKICGTQTTTTKDSVSISISSSPTFTLSNNSFTICAGQTANVQANSSSATSYSWSSGQSTPTVNLTSAGIYTVTASNICGSNSATVNVIISGITPTLQISTNTQSICTGENAILTINSNSTNYNWGNGANTQTISVTNAGVFSATVSNSCGSASSSIQIFSISIPSLTLSASSLSLCPGQTATLTASGASEPYIWSTSTSTTSTIITNSSGPVNVYYTNACGTSSAGIVISSISPIALSLSASSTSICPNETATLTVTGGTEPYTWSNSTSTNSMIVSGAGIIIVTNSNACGVASQSITIIENPINASISANPFIGEAPLEVEFTNNSTNATSYNWDFGNGQTANTQTVASQTYTNSGIYIITLTVSNGVCSDIDSLSIEVLEDEPTLYIPNVFTPNGDYINEIFNVKATNIKEFDMEIFDRWGLKMYSTNDISKGWDGKVKNMEVPQGVYFYLITAKGIDNVIINKQGSLMLLR